MNASGMLWPPGSIFVVAYRRIDICLTTLTDNTYTRSYLPNTCLSCYISTPQECHAPQALNQFYWSPKVIFTHLSVADLGGGDQRFPLKPPFAATVY